jgi:hypothetical protein
LLGFALSAVLAVQQPDALQPVSLSSDVGDAPAAPGVNCHPCTYEPQYVEPPAAKEEEAAEEVKHAKVDLVDGLAVPDPAAEMPANTFEPEIVDREAAVAEAEAGPNGNVVISRDDIQSRYPVSPEVPEETTEEVAAENPEEAPKAEDEPAVDASDDEVVPREGRAPDMSDAVDGPVIDHAGLVGLDGEPVVDHAESVDPEAPGSTQEESVEDPTEDEAAAAAEEDSVDTDAAPVASADAEESPAVVSEDNSNAVVEDAPAVEAPAMVEVKTAAKKVVPSPFGNLKAKLLRGH